MLSPSLFEFKSAKACTVSVQASDTSDKRYFCCCSSILFLLLSLTLFSTFPT
jgi:hypothetical protein